MKVYIEKAIRPKWWNPIFWVLVVITICVGLAIGCVLSVVGFGAGVLEGSKEFGRTFFIRHPTNNLQEP